MTRFNLSIMKKAGYVPPPLGGAGGGFVFDYFEKDHLGNVRMVLTEKQDTSFYPAATMETAQTATEEALYANLPETRTDKSTVPGYPTDNATSPNDKIAKVSGSGQKIGPVIVLKVMAGDKFNIKVSSWYRTNGATPQSPNTSLTDLVAGLITGLSGAANGAHGNVTAAGLQNSGVITPDATSFLNNQPNVSTRPKAYLNWILFDEQFKMVASSSGAEQVPDESAFGTVPNQVVYQHVKTNLSVTKNGYLYVYVSNETPNIDVFFDNLQVTHIKGQILEETHYYPFGLTMAGISSKAALGLENKYKYNNGSELQNKEFSDGSGLELYATNFRSLDPQLGRWWQTDPRPDEAQSPYSAMNNNPILFNDPLGDTLDFPEASPEFINQVYEAMGYLVDNGVGDNLVWAMESPVHFTVIEQKDENGDDESSSTSPKVIWSPTNGLEVDNGNILSPATNLDHEFDHQRQRVTHPEQYNKDRLTPDVKYGNKEEKRVTTGREQKVALALKEIKPGQTTRKDHNWRPNVTTKGPTSNVEFGKKITNDKDVIKKLMEALKKMHDQQKNNFPGGAGPDKKDKKLDDN